MAKLNFKKSNGTNADTKIVKVPTKNKQEFVVDMANDFAENELVLATAQKDFVAGTEYKHKCVARTIIWHEMSKHDETYIAMVFEPFTVKDDTHPLTTAFKATTRLDEKKQASTISKYKDAAVNLLKDKQFKGRQITDYSDELLDEMVCFIKNAGGIDALSKKGKTGTNTSTRMKIDEVNKHIQAYHADATNVVNKFALPANVKLTESNFVTMVGRVTDGEIEVVDVFANDDIIEYVIRNTKNSVPVDEVSSSPGDDLNGSTVSATIAEITERSQSSESNA
ncbi:MAG: hypothetical protein JKY45_04085 [Emcibacter sp.]|nr:hypothetical protein [Emcibacter sp.]